MGALARATDDVERADAMGKLSAGVQRAIRLVEQLLSLARQEPGAEVKRARIQLDELVRDVVAEMIPLADARQIDLGISASESAPVFGDADALRTLVRNLVDNSVRYTPVGGRVDLTVGGVPALLRVIDTGPGIAANERARVFDRFYRPPGTVPPGSGLGMAIVKAVAEAHGASITLDGGPGGLGLAVTVRFASA
jgi:two-component system OmpR family sensor kinase